MEEIHRRIPHRPPFLFVDRIIEINEEDATCELTVREDLDIFKVTIPTTQYSQVFFLVNLFSKRVRFFYLKK